MPTNNVDRRGFYITYEEIVDELISTVTIFPIFTSDKSLAGAPFNIDALWDTGVTVTCIKPELFNRLNLTLSDTSENTTIAGVGGNIETNFTLLNLLFENQINIEYCKVYVADFPGSAEMLIGMDIIGMGDFAVCNTDNTTSFTFVVPPFPDRLNFAEKADMFNEKQKK